MDGEDRGGRARTAEMDAGGRRRLIRGIRSGLLSWLHPSQQRAFNSSPAVLGGPPLRTSTVTVAPGGEETNELSLLGGFVFSIGGDALLGISAGSQRLPAFLAIRDRVKECERYRVLLRADLGAEPTYLLGDLLGDLAPR
jgi:hypothetical protein